MAANTHETSCSLCRIALEHVGVTVGGDTLLNDISMHIHCGQLTALVGPNGGGKTTLLRAILGQIPHTGTIRHMDASGKDFPGICIGYVPQQLPFDKEMPVTVQDLVAATMTKFPVWLGVKKKTRERILTVLRAAQAEKLIDRRLGALSGGELQRVLLAMALSPTPDLLVLDEPVSGVDQNGLALFLSTVSALRDKHHLAILLVSHDWEIVSQFADRAVLVNQKVLAAGTPQEVFASDAFKKTFPAAVEVR